MPDLAPTVAVIGGGQLARMLAEPAAALGIPLRLLAEAEGVSAAQVIPDTIVGDYRDLEMLRKVTGGAQVVTFDHEHVPDRAPARAGRGRRRRPAGPGGARARPGQGGDAGAAHRAGGAVPAARRGDDAGGRRGVRAAVRAQGRPAAGTTAAGCGSVRDQREAEEAFATAAETGVRVLAEELVDFRRELAALVARSPSGQAAAYPVVASTQLDGICHEVVAPAPDLAPELATHAQQVALTIAKELDVVGILAVELFETRDGRVLVNELAMRPHNTGHWTQDGAVTSQFENHLRAVLDLPLGSPAPRAPWTVMVNILGGPERARSGGCTTATRTPWPATRGCGCTSTARSCGPAARSATSTPTVTTSRTASSAPGTPPRGSAATSATRASD